MNYVKLFREETAIDAGRVLSRRALKKLVAPLYTDDVLAAHVAGRTLHKGSAYGSPKAVFDLFRLRGALQRTRREAPEGFSIDAHFRNNYDDSLFKIEYDQVGHLLDAGATLCVTNIHLVDEDLHAFALALKKQLRFSGIVGINCYLSPSGGGLRKHYDTKTAMIIQLEGEKNWRFAPKPVIAFPRRAARERAGKIYYGAAESIPLAGWERSEPLRRTRLKNVLLIPGDILCIAPGTWHEAEASKYSLSLNVYLQPVDFGNVLSDVLFAKMSQRAEWRSGPPVVPQDSIKKPDLVRMYFRSRLRELKNEIDNLNLDDKELWDVWNEYIR